MTILFLPILASMIAAAAVCLIVWQIPSWILWIIHHRSLRPARPETKQTAQMNARLILAGLFPVWNATRIFSWKRYGMIFALAFSGFALLQNGFTGGTILSCALFIAIAWKWPGMLIRQHIVRREREAIMSFSALMDLLRLEVDAGLNLESAFRILAQDRDDVWGVELRRLVFLMDSGVSFDDVLDALSEHFQSDDIHRFTHALKQARQLGVSLVDTLTIQAEMLRTRRRQRAEERARLAAVKIALPLVFCIFPALLIIYLGPAALRISKLF